MKWTICFLTTLLVFAAPSAFARRPPPPNIFDGQRKSLIMGLGLAYSFGSTHPEGRTKVSRHGFGGCLMVGHGWDNRNITVVELNGIGFIRDITYHGCFGGYRRDYPDGMAFFGVSWYHYFSQAKPSGIFSLGLGTCTIEKNRSGMGVRFGAGFELIKHIQIMGFMIVGPSSQNRIGYSLSRLGIFVNPIAY